MAYMEHKLKQNEKGSSKLPANANTLSKAVLKNLYPYAEEVSYPAGDAIVRHGDPGTAFYLVLSGQAEVILCEGERQLPLARLGEGDSFGEMSLFTQLPISADVVTVTEMKLLVIDADRFQDALAASEPLRNHVFTRLCENLRQTSSEAWDLFQHTQALSSLIHLPESDEPIICDSGVMARLKKRLDEVKSKSTPILLTGKAGTGKFYCAKKICKSDSRGHEPLIILDCLQFGENQANKILFGADEVKAFTRRNSQQGNSDLQNQGALHLANKGCIILRHIDAMDISAQKTLCFYLDSFSKNQDIFPQTRVIATTSKDLSDLAKQELFYTQLEEIFASNILEIPTLRQRKRDILPLAKFFLKTDQKENNKSTNYFTRSAEHSLLSGRYQHRNVAELREAVELAASFADGGQIDVEHIFTGPKSQGHLIEYDITGNRIMQWLIKRSSLHLIQGVMLAVFAAIIILCLTIGATVAGRVANTLVWALWWPALLLLFLFVGRLWCTVCPISAIGRIFRSLGSLKRTPPAWLKNRAGWIMAFLFLIIVWTEHVFHMTRTPFATGILLLSLMLMAIVFYVIYQRETWCRYLCPVGSLAAGYSISSTVQVHANPNVCGSQCTTHDCFKGSGTESGCPVYHHPLYVRDSHLCKLCFTCLRRCPHQSARIYLQPPFQNLWRLNELGGALVPFVLVIFFLAIVMLSSHRLPWISATGQFTLFSGLSMVLAYLLFAALDKLFSEDPGLTGRVAYGLLILTWGPFMAYHLDSVPELDAVLIQVTDGSVLSSIFPGTPISLLLVLQFAAVLFTAFCAAISFWCIRARQAADAGNIGFWPWKFIGAVYSIYLLATITLLLT
jgi:transcriptional regulator with AAA-type ATPase domain